jgi:hypothetical protein
MISFKKLFTKDDELRRVQDEVALGFQQVDRQPFMNGVILTGVVLAASSTDNLVNHGLGRVPQGFVILSKNATADIWTSTTTNPRPELTLILRSSAAITATIWIF